ncbi:MAG TPA: glycosyltransferase family 1 protein [Pyrinomonadaceae bacterium]
MLEQLVRLVSDLELYLFMEVIYDVSVLAQAQRYPKARTGVFRVVDNVARGLASSPECNLHFCVSESINEPIEFLSRDAQLRDVDLALSNSARLKLTLYNQIHKLTDRVELAPSAMSATMFKTARKGVYSLANFIGHHGQVLRTKDLAADVYHSPFHPLPEQTRGQNGMKRFLTVYDLIPTIYPQFFETDLKELFAQILNSLRPDDFAFCISECTKHDLCNYRPDLDPARVFVTPLAASEVFFACTDTQRLSQTRSRYHIPEGAQYFLGLSTLEPRKNIEQLIKCFARLVKEEALDDLYLVLVGTHGWNYGGILTTLEKDEFLKQRIIVTGYVPDEDLAPLYSGSLGFIYLSLYEGFGLPLLEAMQCGAPLISSNTSAIPEVVGDAGLMFAPSDEDEICHAMLRLYKDQELRERMSRRSLERSRLFTWERTVSETIAGYKAALG